MKKYFIIAAAIILSSLFLFSSCSKKQSNSDYVVVLTSKQITDLLVQNKIYPLEYVDIESNLYSVPSLTWLIWDFSNDYFNFINKLGETYVLGANNCTSFARSATFYAKYLHFKNGSNNNASEAIGTFKYYKDTGDGHAINIAIVIDGGKTNIVFYEPQSRKITNLTKSEISNCISIQM